jgi:hypothetical protein
VTTALVEVVALLALSTKPPEVPPTVTPPPKVIDARRSRRKWPDLEIRDDGELP